MFFGVFASQISEPPFSLPVELGEIVQLIAQVIKANVRLILLVSMSGLRQISEALCKAQCPLV